MLIIGIGLYACTQNTWRALPSNTRAHARTHNDYLQMLYVPNVTLHVAVPIRYAPCAVVKNLHYSPLLHKTLAVAGQYEIACITKPGRPYISACPSCFTYRRTA